MVDCIKKACVSIWFLLGLFSLSYGTLPIKSIGSYRGALSSVQREYANNTEFGTCIKVRQLFDGLMNNSVDIFDFAVNLSNVLENCHFESATHEAINLLFHYLIFCRPFNFEETCRSVDFICLIKPLKVFLDKSLDDIGFDVVPRDYLNALHPYQKFFLRGFAQIDLKNIIQMCLHKKPLPFLTPACLKNVAIWMALDMAYSNDQRLIFSFTQFRSYFMVAHSYFPSFSTDGARDLFFSDGIWGGISVELQDMLRCIFDDDIKKFKELQRFYGKELCQNFDYIELAALAGSEKIFNSLVASFDPNRHTRLAIFAIQGGCLSIIQRTIAVVEKRELNKEFMQAIRWHRHAVADWLLTYANVPHFAYTVPFSGRNFYGFNNLAFLLMMSETHPIAWDRLSAHRHTIFEEALANEWSALSVFCRVHCDQIIFSQDIGYIWLSSAIKTGIPYFVENLLMSGVDVLALQDKKHKRSRMFMVNPHFSGIINCLKKYKYQAPSV
ncbi:MAG: hypothetical protein US69_C0001G0049 [candidate division TM6 bacterium GW2011_GWF2_38_10]|nr:MAG: hypothetical protein US69_C0001G0049 [candidate division TM6 bacterium GW2011_GWF2_38_10]